MWRIIETSTSYRDPERGGVEGGRGDRVREGGREWGGRYRNRYVTSSIMVTPK